MMVLKKRNNMYLKMVLSILDSGKITKGMVMVFVLILMVLSMKATGKITNKMVMVQFYMEMETGMLVNGRKMLLMVKENLFTQMVAQSMKAIGLMIIITEMESNHGMITQNSLVNTKMGTNMEQGITHGLMVQLMLGLGIKTESTDKVSTIGQMGGNIMAAGKTIIWMGLVFINVQMVDSIKENIKMIKRMEKAYILGPMVGVTMVSG